MDRDIGTDADGGTDAMDETALAVFERHRRVLHGVAYRMLGTDAEAQDVVQEAWLRWSRVDPATVEHPRAYLTRLTTRAAFDQLRRANASRETYIGPWLPEPVATDPADPAQAAAGRTGPAADAGDLADRAVLTDSVSMAMLVVLQTLSPLERAVFVLHEAFGYPLVEVARVLDRSEPAVRQLARRAREHVRSRRPRYAEDRGVRRRATERFLAACLGGDLAELMEVLAPEVTLWADAGGKALAPRRPLRTAERIARFLVARQPAYPAGMRIRYLDLNGGPAALATLDGAPLAAFLLDVDPDTERITTIRLVGNPDKLARLPTG